MSDPLTRAEQVGVLAGQLKVRYQLPLGEAFLAAHLVIAHGWGEQAAIDLDRVDRRNRHAQLAHDTHHH